MTPNAKAANKTMSGLDGLGWPNPEDEPKPKKTMNSQLEIKLATKMTDTPETDYETNHKSFIYTMSGLPTDVVHVEFARKLERERDRLAEALRKLADCDWVITPHDRMDAVREIARKALQSLTPNEKQ
jgi:hypothetical protein